ncbi:MAG TPA: TIGR01841 family phasin [Mesorhizobium sp.]|jgi:phasin family protein
MAKQPEAPNIMEMFSQFGKNLNVPTVDMESILAHHRKNLEALQKAASASAAGAQSIMSKQREALQEGLQEITEMAQNFRAPGAPQEIVAKQADFARKSFETAVKNASEVADIVKKSGSESVDILRTRIQEAMEEIRQTYDKK